MTIGVEPKVAIIGCGRISGHHCESIVDLPGVELVAVCDLAIDKAETYAARYDVKAYESYRRMLDERPEVNTVVIATPSGMHYEHAREILGSFKKHVIVEKPTFLKSSQVVSIYDLADQLGLQAFSVFQNRYNRAVQRVAAGLKSGELGHIRCVSVRVRWCRPQRSYELAPWRGTFAMDGGCLANQGIHHIDLMRYLAGNVKRLASVHKTLGAEIEVEDTALAVLEFESGAVGNLEITTAARPIDYEASISFVCERGLAQIGGIAVNELQVYTPSPDDCAACSEDFSGSIYGNGHKKIYADIFHTLREGAGYPIPREDTFGTIQLLNAFYESNRQQSWVDVESVMDNPDLGRRDDDLAALYRTPIGSAAEGSGQAAQS